MSVPRPAAGGFRPVRAIVIWIFMLLAPAAARADSMPIWELDEKVEQWRSKRKIPPEMLYQVEGRASPLSNRRLQFKNSTLRFESESELPSPTRRNPNVEVTGVVIRDDATGSYSFRIQSARELPTDLETFLERRRQLRGQAPEKWYELGDWARRRGEFYKDPELLSRSDEACLTGFDIEHKALARDDPPGLFELAEKSRRMGLADSVSRELEHEALAILWRKSREKTGPTLDELLKSIAERLPGSTEPLQFISTATQREYLASPRDAYRNADPPTRRAMHRLLYTHVLLRTITPELAADGGNGFAVAEKIDTLIPEQHALAESYRDRALAARSRDVRNLSKSDLLALAGQYRDRQQLHEAEHLIESWLTLRQRRLEPEDTEGLIQLTDEYRALLKRHDMADRLLKEAWKANPRATDVAERLKQAGYRLNDGVWLSAAEFNAIPEGRLQQAIRAGRIETGMTASSVRRSLGEPQRLARAATYGEVTEVWTYDQSGSTRLTVRLKRARLQAELSVVDVTQSSAP